MLPITQQNNPQPKLIPKSVDNRAPHSPKITAKNLPNNRITIKVMPTNRGAAAKTRRPASDRLIFTRLIIHPPVMKRHRNQFPSQKTILFLTTQYYATPPK